jgi:hypothetical protein
MNIRTIYDKYNNGDPISDDEIKFGLKYFKRIESDLSALGPEFKLAANEARRVLYSFQQFDHARREK